MLLANFTKSKASCGPGRPGPARHRPPGPAATLAEAAGPRTGGALGVPGDGPASTATPSSP